MMVRTHAFMLAIWLLIGRRWRSIAAEIPEAARESTPAGMLGRPALWTVG
jgi:hypothetical protein